jgi:hypothetical protein
MENLKLAFLASQVQKKASEKSKTDDSILDDTVDVTKLPTTSESTTSTVPEDFSENSYDENSVSHAEDEELEKVVKPASSTSQSSSLSPRGRVPTEEDVKRIKEELQKNLEEEQMLLSLQMQLLLQLEKLNEDILRAESEERLAKLASQQAHVMRLLRSKDSEYGLDDEMITIQVQS